MNKGLEKKYEIIRAKMDYGSIHSIRDLEDRIDQRLDMDDIYILCLAYGCQIKDLVNKIWIVEIGGAKK